MSSIITGVVIGLVIVFFTPAINKLRENILDKASNIDFLVNLAFNLVLLVSVFAPVGFIVYNIYKIDQVDKEFIILVLIHSLTFIFNISIQFYFWIKRIEKKANRIN